MGVITEAYSIFIKNSTLNHLYPGGVAGYEINVPNRTFCSDGYITRVGFMNPEDNGIWINHLADYNIEYVDENEHCKDICIHAQGRGPLCFCSWLEFNKGSGVYANTEIATLIGAEETDLAMPENRYPEETNIFFKEEIDELEVESDEDGLQTILVDGKKVYTSKTFNTGEIDLVDEMFVKNDDGTTSSVSVVSVEQFLAKSVMSDKKIVNGLSKYTNIMRLFHAVDVSKDKDFQKEYNKYYKITHRSDEFYEAYFELLQNSKRNHTLTFEGVLMFFLGKFGKLEKSLASKLLHTINPQMPIRDTFVLKNLGLKDPGVDLEASINLYKQIDDLMKEKLSSEEGRMIIQVFDNLYPDSDITNMKKYYLYFGNLRD